MVVLLVALFPDGRGPLIPLPLDGGGRACLLVGRGG